ncbi:class I SAM-dependent methyltransferase [Streptomyces sp. NPDC057743]|uniref:class I SAM-dependent methyltransferase n=1 Tax=Streptomyces sp. NPDC057743 TaxID=3346236 RepID=UPI0036871A27
MALGRFLHGTPRSDTPGVTIGPAHAYELFSAIGFAGRRRRAFAQLAALSGAQPGDHALDVGCGTGGLTRPMAQRVGAEGTMLGIDPSPSVLAYARRKSLDQRITAAAVAYQEGTAESLDVPDASMDVVVNSLMLHHLPEELRPVALAEMYRVLRPGGRLLVAEFRPPTGRLGRSLVHVLAGHAMEHSGVDLLGDLLTDTGFELVGHGDIRPWLTYFQGVRPTNT